MAKADWKDLLNHGLKAVVTDTSKITKITVNNKTS